MSQNEEVNKLRQELAQLRAENEKLRQVMGFDHVTKTVIVPDHFKEVFKEAEDHVRSYFSGGEKSPENGEIVISGERYVLIRSAALSFEFMDVIKEFYSNKTPEEATRIGYNFLFDIAHVLGKEDALAFHKKMNLSDPVQKLSAGPVHFAFTGWANVEILPESNPVPNEDYFIKFVHHNSFEAQSWIKAGRRSDLPVCIMNSGYSSGWCEESFGIPLTAVEIECEAQGADQCTFIMAPPDKIQEYLKKESSYEEDKGYDVPVFFERKFNEEALRASLKQKDILLQEVHHRVKNNLQVITSLLNLQKQRIQDEELQEEFETAVTRVSTMAYVQEMIYASKDVSSINVQNYFTQLIKSLYEVYASKDDKLEFDVKIEVIQPIFDPDKTIPLGLIINEIACNSFKHAFEKGQGLFYLRLKEGKDEGFEMIIGDNGTGIRKEPVAGDTLGMSLIEILCEQIEAELSINNSTQGLEYKITFS